MTVPDVVCVGSMAIDSLRSPAGVAENVLGGAAVHGSMAASFFAKVGVVGVIGHDYPQDGLEMLQKHGVDLTGVHHADGKTFRWKGYYDYDLNEAHTEDTQLNVFADFRPELPDSYRKAPYVFLANIQPSLQLLVLDQIESPKLTMADTMNLWIQHEKETLTEVIRRVNVVFMNDAEIRQFTGALNIVHAARKVMDLGPRAVIVKKGEHGAVMFTEDTGEPSPIGMDYFSAPAYPLAEVKDPTGAGDSFEGGFIGYLASTGNVSEANMRRAIVYGSVMASFNVEDFSMNRMRRLTREEICERYAAFKRIAFFEAVEEISTLSAP